MARLILFYLFIAFECGVENHFLPLMLEAGEPLVPASTGRMMGPALVWMEGGGPPIPDPLWPMDPPIHLSWPPTDLSWLPTDLYWAPMLPQCSQRTAGAPASHPPLLPRLLGSSLRPPGEGYTLRHVANNSLGK